MSRFFFRVLVMVGIVLLYIKESDFLDIIQPGCFFKKLSPLHVLWAIWMGDMVMKLLPPKGTLALGATKQCRSSYRPSEKPIQCSKMQSYIKAATKKVLPIFGIWTVLGVVLSALKRIEILGAAELLVITTFFYLCDLICVLFWCPFRVFFMHNRCCTTCRIFNWDHIMMTTPLISIGSFFSWTLVGGSIIMFLIWEYRVFRYPERFCEGTNAALRCSNCTDHLCGHTERHRLSQRTYSQRT